MAIALVTAGGTGNRTGNHVPKQFLTINDIPVIVYTMKNVQNSGCYDDIYVICTDGWKDFINSYAMQYDIGIFRGTISCGNTRFESVSNGIRYLSQRYNSEEVVSIIDANRPLTDKVVFENSIQSLNHADLVLPLEPCFDSMYVADIDKRIVTENIDRTVLYKGQSPETLMLGMASQMHEKAEREGLNDLTTTAILLHYGKKVSFIDGGSSNFKITTSDDLKIFKALVNL